MRGIALLLVAALAAGCAHARLEPPPWTHEAGRHTARLEMAEQLLDMHNPEQALVVLAKAREEEGGSLALDVVQARAWLALGLTGEASAALEPWAERDPENLAFWQVLGLVRFGQKRVEEAESAFRRALALDPRDFDANNNLGFLLLSVGRSEEALPALRAAVAARPTEARARNNLGFALAALGREDEALDVFRATGPEAHALAQVGLAAERRGEPEKALAWYQRALSADPSQPLAVEALSRLDPPQDGGTPP
ncbi:MAG: tetratricopeptide repeat protein [Deltaproteobacteria bacterium]|nr:tetratricopeptide repeat protein [Deltaproteobacteria bacterium]